MHWEIPLTITIYIFSIVIVFLVTTLVDHWDTYVSKTRLPEPLQMSLGFLGYLLIILCSPVLVIALALNWSIRQFARWRHEQGEAIIDQIRNG